MMSTPSTQGWTAVTLQGRNATQKVLKTGRERSQAILKKQDETANFLGVTWRAQGRQGTTACK